MANVNRIPLHAACCVSASLAAAIECAHGGIIRESVHWSVPADDQGLVIDRERLRALHGPAALGDWHVRVFGTSSLQLTGLESGEVGIVRSSLEPGKAGPGELPWALVTGPFSDFGLGTATFGAGVGGLPPDAPNCIGFRFISRADTIQSGWGRLDVGASAASRSSAEIAWQDTPGLGLQVGHTPAAGPMVLLGVATLVGGPRRERAGCQLPARGAA